MAVDPRIALTVKNPLIKSDWQKREDIAGADAAEQRNAMFKKTLDRQDIVNQRADEQYEQKQQEYKNRQSTRDLEKQLADDKFNYSELLNLKNVPFEQREPAWDAYKQKAQANGMDVSAFPEDWDDNILDMGIKTIEERFQKLGSLGASAGGDSGSYGAPREAIDPETGRKIYVQFDKNGNARKVEGFAPPVNLSGQMLKAIDTAQNDYMQASQRANSAQALSEMITANLDKWSAGKYQSWEEGLRDITGKRDIVSQLRTQVIGLKNSAAIQNLPPGVASDKDIELVMKGVPPDDAPPEELKSYVDGVMKMERLVADFNEFKSNYISNSATGDTRGMLKAWKGREVEVPEVEQSQPVQAKPQQPVAQQSVVPKGVIKFAKVREIAKQRGIPVSQAVSEAESQGFDVE